MRKTPALKLDLFRRSVRIFGAECGCNDRAGRKPCIAFEHDEPPGRELAMIRHAATRWSEACRFRQRTGRVSSARRLCRKFGWSSIASGMVFLIKEHL